MQSGDQGAGTLATYADLRRPSDAMSARDGALRASARILQRQRERIPRFLLVLAVVIYASLGFVAPLLSPHRLDFAINYSAATLVRTHGGDIYDWGDLERVHQERIGSAPDFDQLYKSTFTSYVSPPTTAILLLPLSLLPFSVASVVFLLVSNGLFLWSVLLLLRSLKTPLRSPAANLALRCMLPFYPLFVSFFLGQMDSIVILALTLALCAALQRRDARAGAWLMLAAVIKVSPLLVLGFFVARRRWSALVGSAAAGILGGLVTLAVVGARTALHFATHVLPVVGKGSAFFENQSLLGMMYRFALPREAIMSLDAMEDYPTVRLLWIGSSIVLLAVTFELVRRAKLQDRPLSAIAFGVFIVAGLLTGAITWDHYTTWALLPLGALIIDWAETRWVSPTSFWTLLLTAWSLLLFPDVLQVLLYDIVGRGASSLGTYGLLVLLGLMWWRLARAIPARIPAAQAI